MSMSASTSKTQTQAKRVELLAPAGGPEQLECALRYGADAVYVGGDRFGLRRKARGFGEDELRQAASRVHAAGKRIYVTLNALMHDEDIEPLTAYAATLEASGVDAAIVSDPAALRIVRRVAPSLKLHISTQASVTNAEAARFWQEQGASRIVLARELSLAEIGAIRRKTPPELELEVFVHGAMCMAYSGRCLISNYLTGRDANRGHCTQPCRWGYGVVEETRPGQVFPLEEDERGTYLFNSRDLMMLEHLPELVAAGITSIKIEGRMKNALYVATVVKAYRQVLDGADPAELLAELETVSHRPYSTGFFFGPAQQSADEARYLKTRELIGVVQDCAEQPSGCWRVIFELRNRVQLGEELEVLTPVAGIRRFRVEALFDEQGAPVEVANVATRTYQAETPFALAPYDLLRICHCEGGQRPTAAIH